MDQKTFKKVEAVVVVVVVAQLKKGNLVIQSPLNVIHVSTE